MVTIRNHVHGPLKNGTQLFLCIATRKSTINTCLSYFCTQLFSCPPRESAFGAPPQPTLQVSQEQNDVLQMVREGRNVFITGSAGTGKSVLLREIIKERGGLGTRKLAVTASTGLAAHNIGGVTLRSWAGIGLGVGTVNRLMSNMIKHKEGSMQTWRLVETLIIDEVSMVDAELFDKLVGSMCHDEH
ncbi:hypothetical protein OBBRIDRAFT_67058 [Obba rivulosa]|uniref:ATP-dependent DNA helicase n=1 Tax=Obba rivulosa TaxID=1052685 RepID=A0A8E2DHY2_9APHY|nr:hypothetical protein OBBRIDRAFT_67058 [Obba rivulosa]